MMHRITATVLVGITALLALPACNTFNNARGLGDAPVGRRDDSPAEVINMPNRFPNIATKCDGHGHRIYVNTRTAGNITVIGDPTCPGAPR
jgi:hypothetical protein